MSAAPEPGSVLRAQLQDPEASFAIGVPGAVAEFLREPAEPCETGGDGLAVTTPRGGIRVNLPEGLRPLAAESPSRRPERWLQSVVFCLPEAAARMGGRRALTALGPDGAALRARDREDALFDLGVGAPQIDFCVRTGDPQLGECLQAGCGLNLADWPEDLTAALFAANPHRVVMSRLGRIEVTGPIPSERTPLAPHTHLFPDKLTQGAHRDPAVPLPAGWLPCLQLYPPHPQVDLAGEAIPFDLARHEAFQALLRAWGDKAYLAAKAAVGLNAEADGEGRAREVARRQRQALHAAGAKATSAPPASS